MSATPGYNAEVQLGGTVVALTDEPTTKVTANTVYQVTDTAKRVLDPSAVPTVNVDGVAADPADFTVDYYTGTITFDNDLGGSAVVTVTGGYVPVFTVTDSKALNVDLENDALDSSVHGSRWRKCEYGKAKLSGDIELVSDMLTDYDGGAGEERVIDRLLNADKALLALTPISGGQVVRAWVTFGKGGMKVPNDALVMSSLSFTGAGNGFAGVCSFT